MKKILFFLSIAAFSNNVFNLHAEEKDLNEKNSIEANMSSFNDNEIIRRYIKTNMFSYLTPNNIQLFIYLF